MGFFIEIAKEEWKIREPSVQLENQPFSPKVFGYADKEKK